MTQRSHRTLIACSLDHSELGAQLERWRNLARHVQPAVTKTDDGLRLTFPARPGLAAELESLVTVERRCCSFANWSIDADRGQVVLDVRADGDEAIAAVHGMFAGLQSGASAATQG